MGGPNFIRVCVYANMRICACVYIRVRAWAGDGEPMGGLRGSGGKLGVQVGVGWPVGPGWPDGQPTGVLYAFRMKCVQDRRHFGGVG